MIFFKREADINLAVKYMFSIMDQNWVERYSDIIKIDWKQLLSAK